jgi:virginiamycin B lyase
MAFGSDGNLWFTESSSGNFVAKIGKFSPKTGSVTEYTVPTANAELEDISTGPDGNLWFTEEDGKIGKISPETVTGHLKPATCGQFKSGHFEVVS